jgi:hypothetical protein
MGFYDKPLAFTDYEFTGPNTDIHQIAEIGLILAKPSNLDIILEFSCKIEIENLSKSSTESLGSGTCLKILNFSLKQLKKLR